jgi:putative acetyltransferase
MLVLEAPPDRFPVFIRDAHDTDSAAIQRLIAAVWSEYPDKVLSVADDMPELLAVASHCRASGGRFWVALRDGALIGTIAVAPSEASDVVELQKLYVTRSARRHGLGTLLCRLVEAEAERLHASAVELWSDVKLLDAHRLYERLGYARGADLRLYADTSHTVRYYYRKELRDARAQRSGVGMVLTGS